MQLISKQNTWISEKKLCLEIELLLNCVRPQIDSDRIKDLVKENIDWQYLIQTAYRHGVIPLFYSNLSNICPQLIPASFQQQFQHNQYARTQRNLMLTSKLLKLLELFEANDIPVIPFKGPILAISAYGDISRRDFFDLDILVRKEDFLKAKELLTTQGYQPYSNNSEKEAAYLSSLKDKQQKAYLQSHWELHMVDERDRVTIDLHHGMLPKQFSFLYDTEWLWEYAQPKPFANRMVLNLSSEDSILILCSQGAKDCWQQLNRICDIAQVLCTCGEINWEQVCDRAIKLRMTRILLLGLLITHELLEVKLPKTILQQIQADPLLKSLASQIYTQLFYQTESLIPNQKVNRSLFHLSMIEHPLDKIWYCFEHLIVPTVADEVFLPLPQFLSFLYYPLRLIRLIRIYGLKRRFRE
jgi:hypothetical protein